MSWDLPLQLALLDGTISDISGGVQSVTAQSGLINTGDNTDVILNNVGVISLGTGQGAKNTGNKSDPVIEIDISGGTGISLVGTNPIIISQDNILGQYYKTVSQTSGSGTTNVTFNAYTSFTDLSNYIYQSNSSTFTVVKKGIYRIEFLMSNGPNTANWNTNDCARTMALSVTRGVNSSFLIPLSQWIHNSPASNQYGTVVGTLELDVGDSIRCQNVQTVTSGLTSIAGVSATIPVDYNTSFTWQLIKLL